MRLILIALCLTLAACATPQQRVEGDVYTRAYSTIKSLAESAGDAELAGTISTEQEARILDQLQDARAALDLAFRMHLEDEPGSPAQLEAAQALIRELQLKYGDLQ